jgi:hypothetical protein
MSQYTEYKTVYISILTARIAQSIQQLATGWTVFEPLTLPDLPGGPPNLL